MENGDMSDGQLNASTEGEGIFDGELFLYSAKNGRLNRRNWKMCWSPSTSDGNQWFQLHLGQSNTFITSIATQGCPFSTEWTASYKLQYGDDGVHFQYYKERGQNKEKVNHSWNTVWYPTSLRSRRLEVAVERENGRARGRHARGEGATSPLACLLLARPFFLVPTSPSACYAG